MFNFLRGRCFLCLRKTKDAESVLKFREADIRIREEQLRLHEKKSMFYKAYLEEREALFAKREEFIVEQKTFLAEKMLAVEIRERAVENEKEKMLDSESIEIKRKILLPSLKEKWEAEAKKIDAERVEILKASPTVKDSLSSRVQEMEAMLSEIKKKPRSASNNDLLVEAQARLSEVKRVIYIIDGEKNVQENPVLASA